MTHDILYCVQFHPNAVSICYENKISVTIDDVDDSLIQTFKPSTSFLLRVKAKHRNASRNIR